MMARLWNSWSILHTLVLLLSLQHHADTGCSARLLWRLWAETEELAEVVHPAVMRRQLQAASYCIAISTADQTQLQAALDWACGTGSNQGNVNCAPLQEGGSCYTPNTLVGHASYAFNAYYVAQNGATGACSFGGVATPTTTNPSNGTCVYQAYGGSSSGITPSPPPPPSNSSGFSPPSNNTVFGSAPISGTTASAFPLFSPSTYYMQHALCPAFLLLLLLLLA